MKKSREKKRSLWQWAMWFCSLLALSGTIFLIHNQIEMKKRTITTITAIKSSSSSSTNSISIPPHLSIHPSLNQSIITATTTTTNPTNILSRSPYAYVTLISGIDKSFKYRGFFYNTLLMKKALVDLGSSADFIVLLGFDESDISFFENDAKLLKAMDIFIFVLPRFVDDNVHGLSFAEMALLKITPWSFTQYKKVQFFDGDILPTKNMDCFFQLDQNTFTVGAASPLNSGWYLAIPNRKHFEDMRKLALWRLGCDWDKVNGWGNTLPEKDGLFYRGGGKPCLLWDFNGADMDQGLLTHYYILNNGNVILIDTDTGITRSFSSGLLRRSSINSRIDPTLKCCNMQLPTSYFLHFTGQSKPWVKSDKKGKIKGTIATMWMTKLKSLHLNITDCVLDGDCKSPLGYWNRDFPKGGFKVVKESNLQDYRIL